MDDVGLNRDSLVDRAAHRNDDDFVSEVIRLAHHPAELDVMRAVPAMHGGRALSDFAALAPFKDALPLTARIFVDNPKIPFWERIVSMLGAHNFTVVQREQDADAVIHSCCGWDRG